MLLLGIEGVWGSIAQFWALLNLCRSYDLPGARPASSRTRIPLRGGDALDDILFDLRYIKTRKFFKG